MGSLVYGDAGVSIEFDDRTLAHLQTVVGSKLRRGEAMFVSWRDSTELGGGRSSIWVAPDIPLYFRFDSDQRHTMNREWLELLGDSANSAQGLYLVEEPVERSS